MSVPTRIAKFVTEGDVVLSVKIIPNIQHAVLARDEEHALSSRTPATRSKVRGVVLRGHYGCFEVLAPDARGPVAHRHEVLRVSRVALDRGDGRVVLARRLCVLVPCGTK